MQQEEEEEEETMDVNGHSIEVKDTLVWAVDVLIGMIREKMMATCGDE